MTKTNTIKRLQTGLKLLALVLILGFVAFKLKEAGDDLQDLAAMLSQALQTKHLWQWALVLALLPINWLLEAKKWQIAAALHTPITLGKAMQGVLSGLALGFITPHAWGDYAGRIWHLESTNRQYALASVLMTRASQMVVTLLGGLPGFFFLMHMGGWGSSLPPAIWQWMAVGLTLLALLLFFSVGHWSRQLQTSLGNFRWFAYFQPLQGFSRKLAWKLFILSGLRYATFSLQFILLLMLFEVPLPVDELVLGVGFVYLAKSVIPAFNFLSDLGVREFSALLFFSTFEVSASLIVLASLALWLINILLPTLMGSVLIFRARILLPK